MSTLSHLNAVLIKKYRIHYNNNNNKKKMPIRISIYWSKKKNYDNRKEDE